MDPNDIDFFDGFLNTANREVALRERRAIIVRVTQQEGFHWWVHLNLNNVDRKDLTEESPGARHKIQTGAEFYLSLAAGHSVNTTCEYGPLLGDTERGVVDISFDSDADLLSIKRAVENLIYPVAFLPDDSGHHAGLIALRDTGTIVAIRSWDEDVNTLSHGFTVWFDTTKYRNGEVLEADKREKWRQLQIEKVVALVRAVVPHSVIISEFDDTVVQGVLLINIDTITHGLAEPIINAFKELLYLTM